MDLRLHLFGLNNGGTETTIDDDDGVCGSPFEHETGVDDEDDDDDFITSPVMSDSRTPPIPFDTSESVIDVGDETPEPVMARRSI